MVQIKPLLSVLVSLAVVHASSIERWDVSIIIQGYDDLNNAIYS
jgi:hypothetical protein